MSMPASTRISVPPRGPKAPVGRLASLKSSSSVSINRPQSIGRQQPPRPTTHPKTTSCPNPGCPAPRIVDEDGQKLCTGCGTVIAESNIVSEVTFGESSSGAAVVQGTFVGEGQSHTRSFGPGFQRGGGMESREMTEANGNTCIAQLARPLNIPESATKAAGQVFKLAVGLNFIQGRRTKTVAAVCLYIACRRQEGNTVMLIDFADILMVNVFKLGRTYKALLDELRIGGNVFMISPIDPESLIYRFAKTLEFGSANMRVCGEAVRIVQRMNRDWMTTGRRPAGICGAALILAARMNNFRRTVREVVYVVKVAEVTINQRLNEFSSTESGELTVDQFRSVQLENTHNPPSFTRARDGRKYSRSAKKSAELVTEFDDDLESEADSVQPRRVDADGFAIPDLPIDPALTARRPSVTSALNEIHQDSKLERAKDKGKGKDVSRPALLADPTPDDLAAEEALEAEMQKMLETGSHMVQSYPEVPEVAVSDSVDIADTEFDDDPEIKYCLLSTEEVDIKERIWVTENKDYLRTLQEKNLKRALAEAMGTTTTRKPRKRRKTRMGDVTYLEGEDAEGRSRASTPAEATRRMLEVRGYSKKINYSLLDTLYGGEDKNEEGDAETKMESFSRSRSQSRSRSRSMSVASRQSLPPAATPSRRRRNGAPIKPIHSATTPVPESPRASPVPISRPVSKPVNRSAPTIAVESAPLPTPPSTAPDATNKNTPDPSKIKPPSDQRDVDELEEDYGYEEVDDHLEDAFAGRYGDDYYDVDSDSE
ncbi:hypothetical protein N7466_008899 [Penicillium verhagenii]|uniref:uncharacterized protein n=1 Tax=Penicillium verhagenii TaxID=1562060 RepID=UPI002544DAF9|nr:uncharacterized protein N7466_008899 [Penicillium verhagenii]KAJ5924712.1 hypothetical protein N7466_008899 [Penicillium verhagenii]